MRVQQSILEAANDERRAAGQISGSGTGESCQKAIVLAGRHRVAVCTLAPAKPLIDMNRIAGYGRAKGTRGGERKWMTRK